MAGIFIRLEEENKLKKYKDLLKEFVEYIYRYKNKNVIITKHGVQRDYERLDITPNNKKIYFMRAIDSLKDLHQGNYIVYSKSLDLAMVIDYRPDIKSKDPEKHLIIVTIFPHGHHEARKKGDIKIVVESIEHRDGYKSYSDELSTFITNTLNIELNEDDKPYAYTPLKAVYNNIEFTLIFCENKLHQIDSNLKDFDVIEID